MVTTLICIVVVINLTVLFGGISGLKKYVSKSNKSR